MSPPALNLRELRFSYARGGGADAPLLDIASLVVANGDQLLVTGPSGCGKSTLLHLCAGLIEPDAGSIAVAGGDLATMTPAARDEWRGRRIGMIFQTFNLVHGFSAIENVMLALVVSDVPKADHRARATALLNELGLDRHDVDPERMSVGQKQRVAVARALASRPALVLADEPTASLDPDNAAAAMDLIQTACRQHAAALVCTSHDPAMCARFEHRIDFAELSRRPGTAVTT